MTGCQQNSPETSLPAGSWALLGVRVALPALTLDLGSSCPSSEEAEHEKATHAGEGAGGGLRTQTRRGRALGAGRWRRTPRDLSSVQVLMTFPFWAQFPH